MKPQLQVLADRFIEWAFQVDPSTWALTEPVYAVFLLLAAAVPFGFAVNFAGIFIFLERRVAARMQARVGPNRVGPNGLLQFVADGLKCLFKEDLVPADADQPLFRLAPYFVVVGMVSAFAALPFSSALIPTDINIGILFILGITALVAIGVLMSGWGSNSKWALLGGMRAAAQVISYEIPAGLAAMTPIILAGSLSMQELIKAQAGGPQNWAIFHSPFLLVCFFIFFIAQLAEGNRTPFDLPEAESELVSGYNTEYSGMRFLMFFLGEFANVWILAALPVVLFLGGWQIPFGTLEDGISPAPWLLSTAPYILAAMLLVAVIPAVAIAIGILKYRSRAHAAIDRAEIPGKGVTLTRLALKGALDGAAAVHFIAAAALVAIALGQVAAVPEAFVELRNLVAINMLQVGIFVGKTAVLVFLVIQLRWTLPRVRVDQMMSLCWKYLVPMSFVCIVGTLLWELTIGKIVALDLLARVAMMVLVAGGVAMYLRRVKANYVWGKERMEMFTGEALYFPPWRLP